MPREAVAHRRVIEAIAQMVDGDTSMRFSTVEVRRICDVSRRSLHIVMMNLRRSGYLHRYPATRSLKWRQWSITDRWVPTEELIALYETDRLADRITAENRQSQY